MLMEEGLQDGSTVYRPEYIERRRQLGGDTVKDAAVSYEPMTGLPAISLEFNKEVKKLLHELPSRIVRKRMALL